MPHAGCFNGNSFMMLANASSTCTPAACVANGVQCNVTSATKASLNSLPVAGQAFFGYNGSAPYAVPYGNNSLCLTFYINCNAAAAAANGCAALAVGTTGTNYNGISPNNFNNVSAFASAGAAKTTGVAQMFVSMYSGTAPFSLYAGWSVAFCNTDLCNTHAGSQPSGLHSATVSSVAASGEIGGGASSLFSFGGSGARCRVRRGAALLIPRCRRRPALLVRGGASSRP